MDFIAIPAEVLQSHEYQKLTLGNKHLLIELYAMFGDCERFTIDLDNPVLYKQPQKAHMGRKVTALVNSGLIRTVDLTKCGKCHYKRVFTFKYPATEAFEKAA